MKSLKNPGSLTLVTVPIGNMGDITKRANDTLKSADCIACEDTRVTGKLLVKLSIDNRPDLISYRDENECYLAEKLAARIDAGEEIALVSDAGMPVISDPGEYLVKKARQNNYEVICSPGPCAALTGLVSSGLSSNNFLFIGNSSLPTRYSISIDSNSSIFNSPVDILSNPGTQNIGLLNL